ncbi:MAG: hypothetical protein JO056_00370 [Alphaproteobacteria bacterium]|nr:hypothetical protein [Alphaproteobacteria bacterium]
MKITIEMDMTPEEGRRLMGLPDVTALQAEMLDEMRRRMKAAVDASDPQAMLKAWMPLGAQGFEQFQKFLWDSAAQAAGSAAKPGAKKDKP